MRTDTTEVGERGFDEPWELRAFAIAIAAYNHAHLEPVAVSPASA